MPGLFVRVSLACFIYVRTGCADIAAVFFSNILARSFAMPLAVISA
jgi:hypothetical protein